MEKLDIQTQHVGQVIYAFMPTAVPLNVAKSFRNSGIDLFVDEDHLFCRVIPGLARCLLNPACLQPVPIPEKTEDKTAEAEMESYLKNVLMSYMISMLPTRRRKRMRTDKRFYHHYHHVVHHRFCS
jgi:hypothetical protein